MRIVNRLLVCAAMVLLLLAAASSALAQEGRTYRWFIAPEFSFAVSPEIATDYYSTGIGISAGMEFPVNENWSFAGFINYKSFSPDEGTIAGWWTEPGEYPGSTNISVSEGTLTAVTIALQGKGTLKSEGSKFWPYVKGGFGLTFAGSDQIKVDFTNSGGTSQTEWVFGSDDNTNVAILIAIGGEVVSSGTLSFFGELAYEIVNIEGDYNPGVVPIRIGIKF